jgi:ribosomal protein S18 acetylase RimI-like enzyme
MRHASTKPKIHIRTAHNTDRKAIFKFCRKTWSWGDYIPRVWNQWLKDKNSRVFIATINKKPVGIMHLSIDKPQEIWLSGARTDPKYRRIGIATALTKKCLNYAAKKGAKTARLVTGSENTAAQTVLQQLGFQPAAEFTEMENENITPEQSNGSSWAEPQQTAAIWNFLSSSKIYQKSAGTYTVIFHWFSLERKDLERFVQEHKTIVSTTKKGKINGLVLVDDITAREWQPHTIQTCYIDGRHNTTLDMLKFLKNHCHTTKIKKIYGFTCNHKPTTTAMEKLGFKHENSTEILYIKNLP